MPGLVNRPPAARIQEITDVLHGVAVTDPYRWLEEQQSGHTRAWLDEQASYTRSYLDALPGRERIRSRVREFLAVETFDSLLAVGNCYVFRKRAPEQEQPCIYLRTAADGPDQLLLDPYDINHDSFTSVRPLRISHNGELLLFEYKHGGERMGRFGLLDVSTRERYPDELPHGYLRGFAFSPDSMGFYYVHEPEGVVTDSRHSVKHHILGTRFEDDGEIFSIKHDENSRLHLIPGKDALGFVVYHLSEKTYTDFYLWPFGEATLPLVKHAEFRFGPLLHSSGRIFAITDCDAPNFRIVELRAETYEQTEFAEIVPETKARIEDWMVTERWMCLSYMHSRYSSIDIFNLEGKKLRELVVDARDSVRMTGVCCERDEVFLERQSFTVPAETYRYSIWGGRSSLWNKRKARTAANEYGQTQVRFRSKDGAEIPMFLVGRHEVLSGEPRATIMTSYGGYGVSARPQFSVLVMFLMELGCLFVLPRIRGGSDFGTEWHNAARRQRRQVAYDDFISAAEWLIGTGRTTPNRLAIFGGSNSGLLVLAVMTQRPDLFRAVLAIAPLADMLRYHQFDGASYWRDELGTADDLEDFTALASYSPYHKVRDDTAYPATMIVSGDRDQNCNALHARKMTARLQAANVSSHPILLNYHPFRGHSPVLPLSERIDALTDRLAFLTDQLGLEY